MNGSILAGIIIQFAGVVCLYLSWRKIIRLTAIYTVLGWVLQALALIAWTHGIGVEYGLTLGFLCFGFYAWLIIFVQNLSSKNIKIQARPWQPATPSAKKVWQHTARFLVGVLLSGVVSILFMATVIEFLPWQSANRLALGFILLPIMWACLCVWCYTKPSLIKPALTLCAGVGLFSINFIM
ncbi:hypothetical protein [Sessilibacter sp. MAH2]